MLRRQLRIPLLAAASILYVFWLDRNAAVAVMCAGILTWLGGLLTGGLERAGQRRAAAAACGVSVFCCAAALAFYKYATLIFAGISAARGGVSGAADASILARIAIPLGFSFYIFQSISYLVDVYQKKVVVEKNPFRMLLYLTWFPKFISGPIERKGDFDRQLAGAPDTKLFDAHRWPRVVQYLLIGCFYKIVIADRLGIYVDTIFEHYEGFSSIWLLIGAILYTWQIYFDFAGYSYAAVGVSLAFGIRLTENFSTPYMSAGIQEFWRRWHISLSQWLRDYVYIPLGGNRKGKMRKIINTMIVFLLCGMWHGAGLNFVIWGLLHGFYSAIGSMLTDRRKQRTGQRERQGMSRIFGCIVTYIAVAAAWIFFRAPSAGDALRYISAMLTAGLRLHTFAIEFHSVDLDRYEVGIIVVLLLIVYLFERIAYRAKMPVPEVLASRGYIIRYAAVFVLATAIIILGIYGPSLESRMIYMQF